MRQKKETVSQVIRQPMSKKGKFAGFLKFVRKDILNQESETK